MLARWKQDAALAGIRDPAKLAALPPETRKPWESVWADVDALLVRTSVPEN